MEKILSVVVPTYNMEKYLDRCLSSLIVEDSLMDTLEVIVVNDGSKDNSSQIAHSYEAKYPQTFIVVDKENGNYGSCVNKGLDLATGKFFRILDADDWFDNLMLRKFLSSLSSLNSDVVVTGFAYIHEDGEKEIKWYGDNIVTNFQYHISNPELQSYNWLRMHQVTYLLRLLKDTRLHLQHGISYTDNEYSYFPMGLATSIVFLDIVLYQYYIGRDGQTISANSRRKSLTDLYKVAKRLLKDYLPQQVSSNKSVQTFPIKDTLLLFYITVLEDSTFSIKSRWYLIIIDHLVRKDRYLLKYTNGLTSDNFHYVSFWRRWGISRNSGLYKFYKRYL